MLDLCEPLYFKKPKCFGETKVAKDYTRPLHFANKITNMIRDVNGLKFEHYDVNPWWWLIPISEAP